VVILVGKGDGQRLRALATDAGFGKPLVRGHVAELLERVVAALSTVEIAHPVAEKVADLIDKRAEIARDHLRK
jgi:hypothetical protein